MPYEDAMRLFNSNIDYSGLQYTETADSMFATNKEKLIEGAIEALLNYKTDLSEVLGGGGGMYVMYVI